MDISIIYENDSDQAEYEAFVKGYRSDIIVQIAERKYKVYVSSMLRLQQDYNTEQSDSGYYLAQPNTLIVENVTKAEIEFIIKKMYMCHYFEHLDNFGFERTGDGSLS